MTEYITTAEAIMGTTAFAIAVCLCKLYIFYQTKKVLTLPITWVPKLSYKNGLLLIVVMMLAMPLIIEYQQAKDVPTMLLQHHRTTIAAVALAAFLYGWHRYKSIVRAYCYIPKEDRFFLLKFIMWVYMNTRKKATRA